MDDYLIGPAIRYDPETNTVVERRGMGPPLKFSAQGRNIDVADVIRSDEISRLNAG